jgi:hypothetical protein
MERSGTHQSAVILSSFGLLHKQTMLVLDMA